MAAYPTVSTSVESTRAPLDGLQADLADDGTPRARTLFSAITYDFDLVHKGLASADRDSILSHYASELGNTFSYVWPDGSISHNCHYLAAPVVAASAGGSYDVRVKLRGRVA
jgi:hypothetical protein